MNNYKKDTETSQFNFLRNESKNLRKIFPKVNLIVLSPPKCTSLRSLPEENFI